MRRRIHPFGLILLLGCVVFVSAAGGIQAASAASSTPATSALLFNQWGFRFNPRLSFNSLLRADPDGTDALLLTPRIDRTQNIEPAWSPDGTHIAFIGITLLRDIVPVRNLFVMDRQGGGRRQLTEDLIDDFTPSWSPDGRWIAFVSGSSCLMLVRADGSELHTLACLSATISRQAPVWSGDSQSVLIPATFTNPGLHYHLYRADVATGVLTLLLDLHRLFGPDFYVSPDGRKVLLANAQVDGAMLAIDVATRKRTPLPEGHAPLFSRDARRIGFSRTFEPTQVGMPDYTHVFSMDVDGTHVRQLTFGAVDQLRYSAADWSLDGRRLLVNRVFSTPGPNGQPYDTASARMWIIDVGTRAVLKLPLRGIAAIGGWFQPPCSPP